MSGAILPGALATKPLSSAGIGSAARASGLASRANMMTMAANPSAAGQPGRLPLHLPRPLLPWADQRRAMTASPPDTDRSNRLWGGRFARGPAAIMERINASIGFDRVLFAQDIAASKAHSRMLVARGIIGQA